MNEQIEVPEWFQQKYGAFFGTWERKTFTCPRHGDYLGRVIKGSEAVPACPECERLKSEEKTADAAMKEPFIRARKTLMGMVRPYDVFQPAFGTFESFDTSSPYSREKTKAKTACMRFATRFLDRVKSGKNVEIGLLLYGKAGTGKTHLATACLTELNRLGVPGAFFRVADLFDLINAQHDFSTTALITSLSRVSCLVLDDLGVQSWSAAEQKRLQQIIDGRITNRLPTIYTTNLDGKDLLSCLDARLTSRIGGSCYGVNFTWEDHRTKRPKTLEECFGE